MRRREWLLVTVGAALLFSGWLFSWKWRVPEREEIVAGKCRTPVRMLGTLHEPARADVVILHGLGANARIMDAMAQAFAKADMGIYVLDLPGQGNNSVPFSFPRTEVCAADAMQALEKRGEIQLQHTVLVGHSMGGALAIRMADYFPTAATVAISPAPMFSESAMPFRAILYGPPRRMPANLLIFVAQFDFPYAKDSARKLVRAAGGERYKEPEDFLQRRAVRLVEESGKTHTSLIHSTQVWNLILNQWLLPFLPMLPQRYFLNLWFWAGVSGILGLLCLFPIATSGASRLLGASKTNAKERSFPAVRMTGEETTTRGAVLRWVVAGLFAVSGLKFFVPLKFIRMYNGDYLASCLLVAGIVLCAMMWKEHAQHPAPLSWRAITAGTVMGLATMLAFGAWLNWGLTDMWLNAPRWWRFPAIVLACAPFALAEEWALGAPPQKWTAKAKRWAHFVGLRLILYLCMLFALYLYASEQILSAVMLPYMGGFSILTRLGADAVRRQPGAAASAAAFTAILMAWFMAAVFPIS